jgi:hypothetical protein
MNRRQGIEKRVLKNKWNKLISTEELYQLVVKRL